MTEPKPKMLLAALAGAALTAVAVVVTGTERSSDPWAAAAVRGMVVAAPVAVGLYATTMRPYRRFGWLLVLLGAGCAVAALSESDDATAYSIGRVTAWITEFGFVALMLAFPSGRLAGRYERAFGIFLLALLLVVYLPTALLADGYPAPSQWSECSTACPANAFQLVSGEPGFVSDGLRGAREALSIIAYVGVIVLLARRLRSAVTATRVMLVPVLIVAASRFAVNGFGIGLRREHATSELLPYVFWTSTLLLAAIAAAFLIGLLRWEVFSARALERLSRSLHEHPDVTRLRAAMIESLGDPKLDVAFWNPQGRWTDAQGLPLDLASVDRGRVVTTIRDGGMPTVAIIHDPALDEHPQFLEAAGNYAAIALNNHQLLVRIRASMREIQESRARILASADAERRRIERDLHDGAQQRLVALRIKLELVKELIPENPRRGSELLVEIGDETVEALEDVRSLAHGAYPALLAQRGLAAALRDAFLHAPLPVKIHAARLRRYPPEVESGVYFCCLEAVQNAAKHAPSASAVTITLTDDGDLRFEVADNGDGFNLAMTTAGAGQTNMRDRIEGLGGRLTYRSEAGTGTSVSGVVPVPGP